MVYILCAGIFQCLWCGKIGSIGIDSPHVAPGLDWMILNQLNVVGGTHRASCPVEVVGETAPLEERASNIEVELTIILTSIYP
jgi:hypothetical protein